MDQSQGLLTHGLPQSQQELGTQDFVLCVINQMQNKWKAPQIWGNGVKCQTGQILLPQQIPNMWCVVTCIQENRIMMQKPPLYWQWQCGLLLFFFSILPFYTWFYFCTLPFTLFYTVWRRINIISIKNNVNILTVFHSPKDYSTAYSHSINLVRAKCVRPAEQFR